LPRRRRVAAELADVGGRHDVCQLTIAVSP
jgi:hypothetical protein